ncbi:MAG TPA: hypothetical protein VGM81_04590 [Burkholderiaceae bacterium]|jgi:hypothetical protein
MFGWWRRLLSSSSSSSSRAKPAREVLLNDGLELAMDWGESWLAPIQERLRLKHPRLKEAELDELNEACQAAMKFGHETAYELVQMQGAEVDALRYASKVRGRYPWINEENLGRLFRQSLYYVWKAGGPARKP